MLAFARVRALSRDNFSPISGPLAATSFDATAEAKAPPMRLPAATIIKSSPVINESSRLLTPSLSFLPATPFLVSLYFLSFSCSRSFPSAWPSKMLARSPVCSPPMTSATLLFSVDLQFWIFWDLRSIIRSVRRDFILSLSRSLCSPFYGNI